MTLIFPKVTLLDKVLACIGKVRCIVTPKNFNTIYSENPYIYIRASRESFWKALFRHRRE